MEMKHTLIVLTLAALAAFSCKKKEDSQPTGPNETPPENVIGTVTDQNGAPLANVQMHVVYSVYGVPASPLDESQNPTQAVFFTSQTLTTECGGDIPLADGTVIYIMWDADDDGQYSAGDQPPPLCTGDPCEHQTVNFNQFAMNGVAIGEGAGHFGTDPLFSSYGDHLEPSRFYLEIRCSDNDFLWRSDMLDLPDGVSEHDVHFTCGDCVGTPVGETTLGWAYPNPAQNSSTIPLTLRATANVTLSARSLANGALSTLFQGALDQGTHDQLVDISNLPNGLYVYHMQTENFTGQDTLLKIVLDNEELRGTPALATTDETGEFALNAIFGPTITIRENSTNPLGESLPLDSVRVVALLNGYLPADTTISLSSAEQHSLSLRLQSE